VYLPFSTSTSKTVSPFEIVHCDVWTSPVSSISGCKYYLVLLDDFTHFCWTYPLMSKSEVHHIVDFIALARMQFSHSVKCFQANNDSEFVNHAMHSTLAAHSIVFDLSSPYTSPQNGKAERILHTLNNSMRTLLIQASMPPKYWDEAISTTTYLLNHRPSSSLNH
jgi:transposase InsO family protein